MVNFHDINDNGTEEYYNKASEPGKRKKMEELKDKRNSAPLLEEKVFPLILKMKEISRVKYIKMFGENSLLDDPFVMHAERFAEVIINKDYFDTNYLLNYQYLSLSIFDDVDYIASIRDTKYYGNTLSTIWKVRGNDLATLIISSSGKQMVASLKFPDEGLQYLIKYNNAAPGHFLYKILINNIAPFKCFVLSPRNSDYK